MLDLPDLPRWVEAHGIAADPQHWRLELGPDGFALGHDQARLVVVIGDPAPDPLRQLPLTHTVLADSPLKLPRPAERAILHTLAGDPPDYEGATLLPDDAPVPDYLADELAFARPRGPIFTAYVDGVPSTFAYAPWRSPTLFDISVDTIPGARQLGLATIVAAAMIRHEQQQGRQPVWGADEDNIASLRLAARLGFEPVDEIWVAAAP